MEALIEGLVGGSLEGHLWLLALSVARLFPVVFLVPFLGGRLVPGIAKLGLVLSLGLLLSPVLHPAVAASAQAVPGSVLIWLVLKEAMIGLAIGFISALVFYAVQMAGTLIDTVRGQSMAAYTVPFMQEQASQTSALGVHLTIIVYLALGGHHLLLHALGESFRLLPVTEFPSLELGVEAAFRIGLGLTAQMFVIALAISLPVMAATFMVDLALGVLNRAAPQINVFFVGMPIKALLGILILLLALSAIVGVITNSMVEYNDWLHWLIRVLAGEDNRALQ